MNKNIVIAILAIIIIAAVGVSAYTMMQHGKTTENGKINTSIQFLSNDTLKNGDQVAFIVKDAQGTPVANKEVKIIYTEDGKAFDVTTLVFKTNFVSLTQLFCKKKQALKN